MRLAHTLVRALHAGDTHEKLALDALPRIAVPQGPAFHRLMLKLNRLYLDGATAPDRTIGDFENHVVHPRDAYWGGAPRKAESWYHNLVEALAREDWETAAYCAGILGHYATDPLHPFNTAQTEAENSIHAAVNWAVAHAYDDLFDRWAPIPTGGRCVAGTSANWVALLVCEGADHANVFYEKLIAHFDINRALSDPASGLDPVARRIIGSLLMRAHGMIATLMDRALIESRARLPDVALGPVVSATLAAWPKARWARMRAERQRRFEIEDLYQELRMTGTVRVKLPISERVVRDAYQRDIVQRRTVEQATNVYAFNPRAEVVTRIERDRIELARRTGQRGPGDVIAMSTAARQRANDGPMQGLPRHVGGPVTADNERQVNEAADVAMLAQMEREAVAAQSVRDLAVRVSDEAQRADAQSAAERLAVAASAALKPAVVTTQVPVAAAAVNPDVDEDDDDDVVSDMEVDDDVVSIGGQRRGSGGRTSQTRIYLTFDQDVVDAPSIGPKTADRMRIAGIDTVGDFLKAHPIALSARLASRRMKTEVLTDWQDQARLVCSVPGLRGTHAQLLVGAGYRTAEALAAADADKLCADVLRYALTKDGQRVLREGNPPDMVRIKSWAENARAALAA